MIKKLPNGLYLVRVDIPTGEYNETGRPIRETHRIKCESYHEARATEKMLGARLGLNKSTNRKQKWTLTEAIFNINLEKKTNKSFKDSQRYQAEIIRYFGEDILMEDITEARIAGFKTHLKNRPKQSWGKGNLSNQSIDHRLIELKSILRFAHKKQKLTWVPEVKLLRNYGHRRFELTLNDILTVLNELPKSPHPQRGLVAVGLNTGQRWSDVTGLTWKQVDLKEGYIDIIPQKNNPGCLVFPILDFCREILEGLPRYKGVEHVFVDPKTKKPYASIKTSLNTAIKKAGAPQFSFHHLRHATTTFLLQVTGGDRDLVQRLVGWCNQAMVERYGHVGERSEKAFSDFNKLLKGFENNPFQNPKTPEKTLNDPLFKPVENNFCGRNAAEIIPFKPRSYINR